MPEEASKIDIYCAFAGTTNPFPVEISLSERVFRILRISKEMCPNITRRVDVHKIVVWNLKEPIQLDSSVELVGERIKALDLTKDASKLGGWTSVADVYRPEGELLTLYIIIQLPGDSDSSKPSGSKKSRRSNSSSNLSSVRVEDPEDQLVTFYTASWGKPLGKQYISLPEATYPQSEDMDIVQPDSGDLLPGPPLLKTLVMPPCITTGDFLVRAEYIRTYDYVEAAIQKDRKSPIPGRGPAIVITGQPGIGKTTWINYALRRRLGEGKQTIWYQKPNYIHFSDRGVSSSRTSREFTRLNPDPFWCIIDSADSPDGFVPEVVGQWKHGVIPIYVSSPDRQRWKHVHQSKTLQVVIMNPWTWEEIKFAAEHIYRVPDIEEVRRRFTDLGPTPRLCLEFTTAEAEAFKYLRDEEINHMQFQIEDLLALFKEKYFGPRTSTAEYVSYEISLMRRRTELDDGYDLTIFDIPISNLLATNLREMEESRLLDHWRVFSKLPDPRRITGALFEAYMHRRFRRHIKISAMSMFQYGRYHATTLEYDHMKTPLLAKAHRQFLSTNPQAIELDIICDQTLDYDGKAKLVVQNDVYYQPQRDQPAGFDAFVVHADFLYLFQFTGSKVPYSIKDSVLTFLEDSFEGLPAAANRCLVFVFPGYLTEFSCPDSSFGLRLYTASIQTE